MTNRLRSTLDKSIVLAALLCLGGQISVATADEDGQWTGEGELGYTSASGNTDSTNLNAKLGVSRQSGAWKHSAMLSVIQAEADGEDSADSQDFRARSEYSFSETSYLFGAIRYQDDKFSGFDFQSTATVGAGRRLIENETHSLDVSAGLGFRRIRDEVTRDDEDDTIVTGEARYAYELSETATISEDLLVESGDDNTYIESDTALTSKINGNLALKLSYLVKRNSDVPDGTEKTDKITSVSLIYGF